MMTSDDFVSLFKRLGQTWELQDDTFQQLEIFTCNLYGASHGDVNVARYKMYCSKRGKIPLTDLPPCRNTLKLHCRRENYQCRVWRLCLQVSEEIANPCDHGWIDESEATLSIQWMDCEPAPELVGQFSFAE
jgi:hypothetical protein